jgi:trans-aconitate methyltransferase
MMGLFGKLGAALGSPPKTTDAAEAAQAVADNPPEPAYVWQMLGAPEGTHMQFLDPDYAPLGLIDLIVQEPRLVLDVGCYCGGTGAVIKQRWPGATVVGIEPLAAAADYAAGRLDRVVNSMLEEVEFADIGIAPNSVDVIVFADVLEHMYNPWSALVLARTLLTDDGIVLASIPNVRNLRLINNLINGRWTYEGLGLLDVTHIRFFTLAEVRDMFAQTGFQVDAVAQSFDPMLAQVRDMEPEKDLVNLQVGSLVLKNVSRADRMEYAAQQFFVRATKAV